MENSKSKIEQLVSDNVKLVGYVINKFTNKAFTQNNPLYDAEDIMQLGLIGLFKAARSYDESKGYAFSTMAVSCIRNEIYRVFEHQQDECIDFNEINLDDVQPLSVKDAASDNLMYEATLDDLTDCLSASVKNEAKTLFSLITMGYKIDEAAKMLEMKPAKAYKILHKVRSCYVA